mgnify:FL=1
MATFKNGDIVSIVLNEKSTGAKKSFVGTADDVKTYKVEAVKTEAYATYESGYIYRLEGCGALLFSDEELVMVKEKIITEEAKRAMATLEAQSKKKKGVELRIINDIKKTFKSELRKREYNYEDHAISTIFNEWLEQKAGLIALLSQHPNWDPNQLMVHFDADYTRATDSHTVECFLSWMRYNTNVETIKDEFGSSRLWFFLSDISRNTHLEDATLNKGNLDFVNSIDETFNFRDGMKTTKVVGKIAKFYGWDDDNRYKICPHCTAPLTKETEQRDINGHMVDVVVYVCPECGKKFERSEIKTWSTEYAKFADALSPLKITRHTCISLNPIDYLLMSNGNSWRSCHYIGDNPTDNGCYSSGTISYMLDSTSMIFYTVDGNHDGDYISTAPKIQRQVFAYSDGCVLQSRLYPQSNDYGAKETYTDIRNVVQKVLADCLDLPNLWVKKNGAKGVVHGSGATCYPDWSSQSELCSVSIIKDIEDDHKVHIVVGAQPICIVCGSAHYEESCISCCGCGYHCECCGNSIWDEDVYWINDDPYCPECVTYCECCDEYYLNDDVTWIESEGRYVCDSCLREYYTRCDKCGAWVDNDRAEEDDSGHVYCGKCAGKVLRECEECGCIINTEYDAFEIIDGRTLCYDCATDVYVDKANEQNSEEE